MSGNACADNRNMCGASRLVGALAAAQRQDNSLIGPRRDFAAAYVTLFSRISPMSLTASDIARIAALARLSPSAQESAHMLADLNSFFGIVQAMQAVDTSGVQPLAHPVELLQDITLRLRDDAVTEPTTQREANMRNAPATSQGLFLVPRVIE